MLFWEHYQSTSDRFSNYQLEPYRCGYSLNGRGRIMFLRRAERFMRKEGLFIKRVCVFHTYSGVSEWTFKSRENGYVFKLVGRNEEFILLQVNRRRGEGWDTPVIRNYFGFLAFMLHETCAGCNAELMGFDC